MNFKGVGIDEPWNESLALLKSGNHICSDVGHDSISMSEIKAQVNLYI